MNDSADIPRTDPEDRPAPAPERLTGAHRWWLAGAVVLGVVSVVAVPLAVYVFVAPGHLGVPYQGKLAWLAGVPVWGMVECVRRARAARAALR